MTSDLTPAGWDVRSRSAVARRSSAVPDPPPPPQPPVYYGCVNLYRVLLPTCHCFALRFLGQRQWRWVRTDSRGDARAWLGEAVIQTLNVVFWLYLTSYLAQEDARQLFECRTPSLVHTHHLVVCRPPTTEILTENRFQRTLRLSGNTALLIHKLKKNVKWCRIFLYVPNSICVLILSRPPATLFNDLTTFSTSWAVSCGTESQKSCSLLLTYCIGSISTRGISFSSDCPAVEKNTLKPFGTSAFVYMFSWSSVFWSWKLKYF